MARIHRRSVQKKYLHNPDNKDGVITHLEPDILECEVKWALESITTNKASGGDGIPVELFQMLKDDAVKVLHSICQKIWKTQQWPQDWERSIFIPIPKNVQLPHNCIHLTCYNAENSPSQASTLYMSCELPYVQAGFRKGRGTRDQIANVCWIIEKAREFQKNSYFCFIDYAKALTVWITLNCGKF